MNWELYIAFFSASFALALMPGPDNIYVLTESLSRGSKRGISLSSGLASGLIIHTSLAATGLALLLQQFHQGFLLLFCEMNTSISFISSDSQLVMLVHIQLLNSVLCTLIFIYTPNYLFSH